MSEMKIYSALLAIADSLRKEGIAKNATCSGGGNFKYRSIDAVYAALSPLLVENKVVVFPEAIERLDDVQAGKMRLVRINVTYRAVCTEDGSSITFSAIGEGCDTSDKAAGKAMSYAYKTAMFQVFCVPVEGQEDPDQVVHQIAQPFVPAAVAMEAERLKDVISACETTGELDAVAAQIGKLGLPTNSQERAELLTAYKARKQIIIAQNQ